MMKCAENRENNKQQIRNIERDTKGKKKRQKEKTEHNWKAKFRGRENEREY